MTNEENDQVETMLESAFVAGARWAGAKCGKQQEYGVEAEDAIKAARKERQAAIEAAAKERQAGIDKYFSLLGQQR
jgi:hypothetical protein